jgi:hypothetical protein
MPIIYPFCVPFFPNCAIGGVYYFSCTCTIGPCLSAWPSAVVCKRENIRLYRLESGHRSLQHLDQALIEQRDAGWSFVFATSTTGTADRLAALHGTKRKVSRLSGDTKLLQALRAVAYGHGVRNVSNRLRRLTYRTGRDQLVGRGVDRGHAVGVFQPDVNPAAVAGRPHAVRQLANRYRRS